jgi:hypothetical protein
MAAFILPEYHMVSVGKWEPEWQGRLPLIYSVLPSGRQLPTITPASPDDIAQHLVPPTLAQPAPALDTEHLLENLEANPDALQLEAGEVKDFVAGLIHNIEKRK